MLDLIFIYHITDLNKARFQVSRLESLNRKCKFITRVDAGIVINRKISEFSEKEDGNKVYIKLYVILKVFYKYK